MCPRPIEGCVTFMSRNSNIPDRDTKTLDGDRGIEKYRGLGERHLRNGEERGPPMGRLRRAARKQIEAEGTDGARKHTCYHAWDKASRGHCLQTI